MISSHCFILHSHYPRYPLIALSALSLPFVPSLPFLLLLPSSPSPPRNALSLPFVAFEVAIAGAVGWQQWMVDDIIHNALKTMTMSTSASARMMYGAGAGAGAGAGVDSEGGGDEEEQVMIHTASAALRRMRATSSGSDSTNNSNHHDPLDNHEYSAGDGDDIVWMGDQGQDQGRTRSQALVRLLTDPAAFSRIVVMVG